MLVQLNLTGLMQQQTQHCLDASLARLLPLHLHSVVAPVTLTDDGVLARAQDGYGHNADCTWTLTCSDRTATPVLS